MEVYGSDGLQPEAPEVGRADELERGKRERRFPDHNSNAYCSGDRPDPRLRVDAQGGAQGRSGVHVTPPFWRPTPYRARARGLTEPRSPATRCPPASTAESKPLLLVAGNARASGRRSTLLRARFGRLPPVSRSLGHRPAESCGSRPQRERHRPVMEASAPHRESECRMLPYTSSPPSPRFSAGSDERPRMRRAARGASIRAFFADSLLRTEWTRPDSRHRLVPPRRLWRSPWSVGGSGGCCKSFSSLTLRPGSHRSRRARVHHYAPRRGGAGVVDAQHHPWLSFLMRGERACPAATLSSHRYHASWTRSPQPPPTASAPTSLTIPPPPASTVK